MAPDARIASSIRETCIERVLVVDDAYDPPAVTNSYAGSLLEFLDQSMTSETDDDGIDAEILQAARTALASNDLESEAVEATIAHLFSRFCEDGDETFDPGGFFAATKGAGLDQLRPLVKFLRRTMTDMAVQTTGLGEADTSFSDFGPQLLFVDYYLDRSSEPGTAPSPTAREASMEFLKRVIARVIASANDNMPSVVLMSTHEITDVDEYRHETDDRILAVRFGFLEKRAIHTDDQSPVRGAAADVILDAFQGYRFGNLLQGALSEWHGSVHKALKKLKSSIGDLSVKDFAYLIRFRLRSEANGLAEYLDWLFGENVRGLTECAIPWSHGSFTQLDSDTRLENSIEGALDGPTLSIAKLFHGARVGGRRGRDAAEYRLGDIYLRNATRDLRVVISPNCDLVRRPSGNSRRLKAKAPRVLTMGGTLYEIDSKEAVADELFIFRDGPHYIGWNPKDLCTFPIQGDTSMHSDADFQYVGTLTPLYALKTQGLALADLSRIGLPVAPAFGVSADVRVWVKLSDKQATELDSNWSGIATIVPRREGHNGHGVLLARSFVNELLEKLDEFYQNSDQRHAGHARILGMQRSGFFDWLVVKGAELNADPKYGTTLMFDKPINKGHGSCLQLVLRTSSHALDSIRTIDPLASTS